MIREIVNYVLSGFITENDAFTSLEEGFNILIGAKEISRIYSVASALMKPARVLSSVDAQDSAALVANVNQLFTLGAEDLEYVPLVVADGRKIVERLKNKLVEKTKQEATYLKVKREVRTSDYERACSKYAYHGAQIKKLEQDVQKEPTYNSKLHELMRHGKYQGKIHARLTDNLRLIYSVDSSTRTIVFENIITHDELDKS